MKNDSRKRRKTPSSCGNLEIKDEQPIAKIQCRSRQKSTQNESISRQKERLILARASVVKERLWKESIARQLAYEAMEYRKSHFAKDNASSSSTDEVITFTKDEVFTAPFNRQFLRGLQDMVRERHKKKFIKHEKLLRKFQHQCELEESAVVYGFKSDVNLGLLDIKVPTLPCIAAPNEPEKDFLAIPSAKPNSLRKLQPNRATSKTGVPMILNNNEDLTSPSAQLLDRRANNRRNKRCADRSGVLASGRLVQSTSHPGRGGRRRKDYLLETRGSDLSLSQADLDGRQMPPTIDDFLARGDDQLLFITSAELYSNWDIVSDVMASAGFFMSPEACKERHLSIETTIKRHQSQLIRSGEQGSMDDMLLKQLRTTEVKEGIRKRIPDPLAAKYAQHTSTVHRKRIQKLKNQTKDEGPPQAHVSQRKLSDEVLKTMGGRVGNPKESWTKAQKQNVARSLATKYGHNQIAAAKAAARQNLSRLNIGGSTGAASQPTMASPGTPFEPPKRIQSPQQQGQMHLNESLTDPNGWCGNGLVGTAPQTGGHVQNSWMNSPAQGLPPLQGLMGPVKASGSAFPGGPVIPSFRPGFNPRGPVPQHLMGMQPPRQEQQVGGRGGLRGMSSVRPMVQGPLNPGSYNPQQQQQQQQQQSTQQSTHQFMSQLLSKFQGNTALLQQYIQSGQMRPEERFMLNQALQNSRQPQVNVSNRVPPTPAGPQVISSGTGNRKPHPMTSTGEQFNASHNMATLMPSPPVLEHPSQFNPRTPSTPVREYLNPSVMASARHPNRPRTQHTAFPYDHSMEGGMESMNPVVSQMELRQDMSSNTVDVHRALHGVTEDRNGPILDAHQGLQQNQMTTGNYPEMTQEGAGYHGNPRGGGGMPSCQLPSYTRLTQRPHGP
eukprot:g4541.t1